MTRLANKKKERVDAVWERKIQRTTCAGDDVHGAAGNATCICELRGPAVDQPRKTSQGRVR